MLETLQACFGAHVSGNANRLALARLNTNTSVCDIVYFVVLQNATPYIFIYWFPVTMNHWSSVWTWGVSEAVWLHVRSPASLKRMQ